jgi:hypothetical protein
MSDPTNAQDFCKEVQKKRTAIGDITDMLSQFSPANLINACLGKLGASAESTASSKSLITNSLTQSTISDIEQKCSNNSTITQSNLVDKTSCIVALGCGVHMIDRVAAYVLTGTRSDVVDKILADASQQCNLVLAGKNEQSNTLTAQQNCVSDGVLTLLSQATLDSSLMAILQQTQAAKGLLSSAKNSSNSCDVVSNTMSVSTYTKQYQVCSNACGIGQSNIAMCVGTNQQSNTAAAMDACMESTTNIITTGTSSTAASTDKKTMDTTASGLTTGMILAILALGLGGFYVYTQVRSGGGSSRRRSDYD